MSRYIAAIAVALIVAIVSFGEPAHAGGKNVKLQFGGPLGAFTATGNGKHKSKSYSSKKHTTKKHTTKCGKQCRAKLAKKRLIAKKKAAAKRKAVAAAKAKARRKAIAAKRREKARQLATANAKAQAAKREQSEQTADNDAANDDKDTTTAASTDKTGVNVSTLAAINKPLDQVVDKDKDANKDGTSSIETGTTDQDAEEAEDLASADSCKKYVPSAGLTITVPCEDE